MSKPIPIPKSISKGSLIDYPIPTNPMTTDTTTTPTTTTTSSLNIRNDDFIMGYDRRFPNPPSYPKDRLSLLQMEQQVTKMLYQSSPSQYDNYLSPDLLREETTQQLPPN